MCSSPARNLWTRGAKTSAKASSMYFHFLISRIFCGTEHHLSVLQTDQPSDLASVEQFDCLLMILQLFFVRHCMTSIKNA